MDGGWQGKRMMVGGERELRRVSMTRLGCLVGYPKSGEIFKVRPKTRHLSSKSNLISVNQRSLSPHSRSHSGSGHRIRYTGGGIALSNDPKSYQ